MRKFRAEHCDFTKKFALKIVVRNSEKWRETEVEKNLRTKSWPWDGSKPATYAMFRRTQYWLGCLAFIMPPRKNIKLESLELNIAISRAEFRKLTGNGSKRKYWEQTVWAIICYLSRNSIVHRGAFASFFSSLFIIAIAVNPPERKLAKAQNAPLCSEWVVWPPWCRLKSDDWD